MAKYALRADAEIGEWMGYGTSIADVPIMNALGRRSRDTNHRARHIDGVHHNIESEHTSEVALCNVMNTMIIVTDEDMATQTTGTGHDENRSREGETGDAGSSRMTGTRDGAIPGMIHRVGLYLSLIHI